MQIIFGEKAKIVQPLGTLFINLLLMAAIPLVFFNLLAGLTSLTDVRVLGRIGGKIILYYLFTTVTALTLGLLTMNFLKPGVGMTLTEQIDESFGEVPSIIDLLLDLIPQNIFAAFSAGKVSQIVVFAIFIGITTLLLPADKRAVLNKGFDVIAELLRKLVDVILRFGPIGIGALAASNVGKYGSQIFGPLALFIAGVLLFTAQAAGVSFDLAAQVTIVLIGLILSEGSGGIPGGGFVIALIFVQAFNLPLEIAAIVGGIYRLIDMGSTTVNCMGDLVGTSIVSHFENK